MLCLSVSACVGNPNIATDTIDCQSACRSPNTADVEKGYHAPLPPAQSAPPLTPAPYQRLTPLHLASISLRISTWIAMRIFNKISARSSTRH
jgi:hypothetical protein